MGMTDRDRKLMAVLLVAVLLGGYWFLVLGKKRSAVADAEMAVSQAQQELDAAKAAEVAGQQAKKRFPVAYSRVVRLGKAVPDSADFASLVVQVSDVSVRSGVRFVSLTTTEGAAAGGATGTTGLVTTCGESGSTADTGAAAPAPTAATGTTGAPGTTGATGATDAQSGVGQAVNDANAAGGAASADANRAGDSNADAADCAAAPTLTDLAASQAGLKVRSFSFKFQGSFFKLHDVMDRLLGLVRVKNGKVKATGRLLQINSIKLDTDSFPVLDADVQMTGYTLPKDSSLTAGATPAGPAGAPAGNTTPSPAGGGAQ